MTFSARSTQRPIGVFGHTVKWLRALMIIWASWNGPLLWGHAHGTPGNSPESEQEFLREHLHSHHKDADPDSDCFYCWHFHVEFPAGNPESNDVPARHLSPAMSDAGTASLIRTAADTGAFSSDVATLSAGLPPIRSQGDESPQHFFDSFAPDLSLPLRHGVIRC